jgi:DNA-binding cell septation regulator SpoVG
MKVAKVWVNKYDSGSLIGYAAVRFALRPDGDGCLTIQGWPIFRSNDGGMHVGMPSEKSKTEEGKYNRTVDIYQENEDGKALLEDINQQVAIQYNSTEDKDRSHQSSDQSTDNNSSTENNNSCDAIPF